MKKEYAIQYIDGYGDALRIKDDRGYTKKYTLAEAEEVAIEKMRSTGRTTKICKGWTVVKTFEA